MGCKADVVAFTVAFAALVMGYLELACNQLICKNSFVGILVSQGPTVCVHFTSKTMLSLTALQDIIIKHLVPYTYIYSSIIKYL